MSLNSSLAAAVSGLGVNATKMATISDNIANSQTTGFKRTEAQFSTLVTGGSMKGSYSAGGVAAVVGSRNAEQGLLAATTSDTDLALDGRGFFVVRGSDEPGADATFTRAGSFRPDKSGAMRNAAGFYLQGWRVAPDGSYTNTGTVSSMEPVSLAAVSGLADPTTSVNFRANLAAAEAEVPAYATGDMASGALEPQFQRVVEVFDAQGTPHRLQFAFAKLAPNRWAMEVIAQPAADVSTVNGLVNSGELVFDPSGKLDLAATSPGLLGPTTPAWTGGAGGAPLSLTFGDAQASGLTQFGGPSALVSGVSNGGLLGVATGFKTSPEGQVSAVFDNGSSRVVYQLPIATFANPDGLLRRSGNTYQMSDTSGDVIINAAGEGGAGAVVGGTLEGSTVDIATEFADMIKTQRAYSANARVVTTADEMMGEIANLKR